MLRKRVDNAGFIIFLIIPLLVSVSCASAGTNSLLAEEGDKTFKKNTDAYRQGEILVKFKEAVSEEDIKAINKKNGAEILEFIKGIKVYRLKIITNKPVEDMVEAYSKDPRIEYAEPNYIQRTMERGIK